jgi:hypothetical protein
MIAAGEQTKLCGIRREGGMSFHPKLIQFVQQQFSKRDIWCWETIVEEVAEFEGITLDMDRMAYAGGSLRTGRYRFDRNGHAWDAICAEVVGAAASANDVIVEVLSCLTSSHASGVAESWMSRLKKRIEDDESECNGDVDDLLNWESEHFIYRGTDDGCPELSNDRSIVYCLWRLDVAGEPAVPFPLYVGETRNSMIDRLVGPRNKCHRDWWGPGKHIGVTFRAFDDEDRKYVERRAISLLVPFSNSKRSGPILSEIWDYPRP